MLPTWCQVSEERCTITSTGNIVEGEFYTSRVGHGKEVKHTVGGTTEDHGKDEGVLESRTCEKVTRANVLGHGGLDDLANSFALSSLLRRQGRI
jgi:hypothetical protein